MLTFIVSHFLSSVYKNKISFNSYLQLAICIYIISPCKITTISLTFQIIPSIFCIFPQKRQFPAFPYTYISLIVIAIINNKQPIYSKIWLSFATELPTFAILRCTASSLRTMTKTELRDVYPPNRRSTLQSMVGYRQRYRHR